MYTGENRYISIDCSTTGLQSTRTLPFYSSPYEPAPTCKELLVEEITVRDLGYFKIRVQLSLFDTHKN